MKGLVFPTKIRKQIFQANGQGKKAGVAILISDKIDFQRRAIKRDPEGCLLYTSDAADDIGQV